MEGLMPGYFEGELAKGCTGENGSPNVSLCQTPVQVLVSSIGPTVNMTATRLHVSSSDRGGQLAMLPNVDKQVHNQNFDAIFWIETISSADGEEIYQLQYAQKVNFAFEQNFACRTHPVQSNCNPDNALILWRHVQANTLRRALALHSMIFGKQVSRAARLYRRASVRGVGVSLRPLEL